MPAREYDGPLPLPVADRRIRRSVLHNSLLTRAEYIANLKHRFASTKFQEEKVAASITRRYSFAQECVGFFMSKCDDRFSSHRCLPLFQFNPD